MSARCSAVAAAGAVLGLGVPRAFPLVASLTQAPLPCQMQVCFVARLEPTRMRWEDGHVRVTRLETKGSKCAGVQRYQVCVQFNRHTEREREKKKCKWSTDDDTVVWTHEPTHVRWDVRAATHKRLRNLWCEQGGTTIPQAQRQRETLPERRRARVVAETQRPDTNLLGPRLWRIPTIVCGPACWFKR